MSIINSVRIWKASLHSTKSLHISHKDLMWTGRQRWLLGHAGLNTEISRHCPKKKPLQPNSRQALSTAKFPFRCLIQTPAKSVDVSQSKFRYRITFFCTGKFENLPFIPFHSIRYLWLRLRYFPWQLGIQMQGFGALNTQLEEMVRTCHSPTLLFMLRFWFLFLFSHESQAEAGQRKGVGRTSGSLFKGLWKHSWATVVKHLFHH